MKIFKTKWFARFARSEHISDDKLTEAALEIEKGINDGELGGGLVKKRIARKGEGKRSGFRAIVVYRTKELMVFVYGFPKNVRANLSDVELDAYKKLSGIYLGFSCEDFERAVKAGEVEEVKYYEEEI